MLVATMIVILFGLLLLSVLGALVWAISTDERNEKACEILRRLRRDVR